jgi:NAD(P)-dependent dehydrogenase (short-subunit alcohol dehydrogenase family)
MKLSSPSVLITGGGSGIGRETVIVLARRGARITLSGRKEAPLQECADSAWRSTEPTRDQSRHCTLRRSITTGAIRRRHPCDDDLSRRYRDPR